jgi:hypothetical protein
VWIFKRDSVFRTPEKAKKGEKNRLSVDFQVSKNAEIKKCVEG